MTVVVRALVRTCAALALAAGIVGSGAQAGFAKDLCVHTTAAGGWTFVLKKASLRHGSAGAIAGYALPDSASNTVVPISGTYLAAYGALAVGITRFGIVIHTNSSNGSDYGTTFHQIRLTVGTTGDDRAWTRNDNGTTSDEVLGTAAIVDCATAPLPPPA
jgi:hypothetical protein